MMVRRWEWTMRRVITRKKWEPTMTRRTLEAGNHKPQMTNWLNGRIGEGRAQRGTQWVGGPGGMYVTKTNNNFGHSLFCYSFLSFMLLTVYIPNTNNDEESPAKTQLWRVSLVMTQQLDPHYPTMTIDPSNDPTTHLTSRPTPPINTMPTLMLTNGGIWKPQTRNQMTP